MQALALTRPSVVRPHGYQLGFVPDIVTDSAKATRWDTVVWAEAQGPAAGPCYGTLLRAGTKWQFWPAERPTVWHEADWGFYYLPLGPSEGSEIPVVRLRRGLPVAAADSQDALTAAVCLARMYTLGHLDHTVDAAQELVGAIERLSSTMDFEQRFGYRPTAKREAPARGLARKRIPE
jgi:hypothetical protein